MNLRSQPGEQKFKGKDCTWSRSSHQSTVINKELVIFSRDASNKRLQCICLHLACAYFWAQDKVSSLSNGRKFKAFFKGFQGLGCYPLSIPWKHLGWGHLHSLKLPDNFLVTASSCWPPCYSLQATFERYEIKTILTQQKKETQKSHQLIPTTNSITKSITKIPQPPKLSIFSKKRMATLKVLSIGPSWGTFHSEAGGVLAVRLGW